jgi:hypothetical protein
MEIDKSSTSFEAAKKLLHICWQGRTGIPDAQGRTSDTLLVLGHEGERATFALRMARLLSNTVYHLQGEPSDVLDALAHPDDSLKAHCEMADIVLCPFYLHDCHDDGLSQALLGVVREQCQHASLVVADYTLADADPQVAATYMTADIEQRRMHELGLEQYLREHRQFSREALHELLSVHWPFVASASLGAGRSVAIASPDLAQHQRRARGLQTEAQHLRLSNEAIDVRTCETLSLTGA